MTIWINWALQGNNIAPFRDWLLTPMFIQASRLTTIDRHANFSRIIAVTGIVHLWLRFPRE